MLLCAAHIIHFLLVGLSFVSARHLGAHLLHIVVAVRLGLWAPGLARVGEEGPPRGGPGSVAAVSTTSTVVVETIVVASVAVVTTVLVIGLKRLSWTLVLTGVTIAEVIRRLSTGTLTVAITVASRFPNVWLLLRVLNILILLIILRVLDLPLLLWRLLQIRLLGGRLVLLRHLSWGRCLAVVVDVLQWWTIFDRRAIVLIVAGTWIVVADKAVYVLIWHVVVYRSLVDNVTRSLRLPIDGRWSGWVQVRLRISL